MKRYVLALVGSTLAASCGGAPPPCTSLPLAQGEQLLREWQSLAPLLRSLRAEAKVSKSGAEGRLRGSVWMLVEQPDRLRIDIMSPLGPAATFASDGQQLTLIDLRQHRVSQGDACSSNVARFLGVGFAAKTVVQMLLGQPPELRGTLRAGCSRAAAPELRLHQAGGGVQELTGSADRPSRLLRVEQRDAQERTLWRVEFADHRRLAGDRWLPHRLRFYDGRRRVQLELRMRSMEPDVAVPAEAFQLPPPAGMPLERWACER